MGMGIGDWGLGPIPIPIPNPQLNHNLILNNTITEFINNLTIFNYQNLNNILSEIIVENDHSY